MTATVEPTTAVRVRAWPRLHFGLLDLGGVTPWRYGGAGCLVSAPAIEVYASTAEAWSLQGLEAADPRTLADADALIHRLSSYGCRPRSVVVQRRLPEHVGLGSKTATLLAIARAVGEAQDVGLDRNGLQRVVRRGGTSGAGVNLFFDGGFVVDRGHPDVPGAPYGPSSSTVPSSPPPVLARHPIPESWEFTLVLPMHQGVSGKAEQDLFAASTPLSREDVLCSIAAMHHGVVAGFAAGDLEAVRWGLSQLHAGGFKAHELAFQGADVRALYSRLVRIPDVAVGLSSVGPLMFLIRERTRGEPEHLTRAVGAGFRVLGPFRGINHGAEVRAVE
jgi:beta-ribofuranosylaminobenzene 5'-phosphate synthase